MTGKCEELAVSSLQPFVGKQNDKTVDERQEIIIFSPPNSEKQENK